MDDSEKIQEQDTELDIQLDLRKTVRPWVAPFVFAMVVAGLSLLLLQVKSENRALRGELKELQASMDDLRVEQSRRIALLAAEAPSRSRPETYPEFESPNKGKAEALAALVEDMQRTLQLGEWIPLGPERWAKSPGQGKGFSIRPDRLLCAPPEGTVWRLIGEKDWDRYVLEVEFRTENVASLFINASDDGTGYLIELPVSGHNDTVHRHRLVSGQDHEEKKSQFQETRPVGGEWQLLRVLVSPDRVRVYLEDTPMYDFLSVDIPAGKIGFYGWAGTSAEFRKLRILLPPEEAETLKQ